MHKGRVLVGRSARNPSTGTQTRDVSAGDVGRPTWAPLNENREQRVAPAADQGGGGDDSEPETMVSDDEGDEENGWDLFFGGRPVVRLPGLFYVNLRLMTATLWADMSSNEPSELFRRPLPEIVIFVNGPIIPDAGPWIDRMIDACYAAPGISGFGMTPEVLRTGDLETREFMRQILNSGPESLFIECRFSQGLLPEQTIVPRYVAEIIRTYTPERRLNLFVHRFTGAFRVNGMQNEAHLENLTFVNGTPSNWQELIDNLPFGGDFRFMVFTGNEDEAPETTNLIFCEGRIPGHSRFFLEEGRPVAVAGFAPETRVLPDIFSSTRTFAVIMGPRTSPLILESLVECARDNPRPTTIGFSKISPTNLLRISTALLSPGPALNIQAVQLFKVPWSRHGNLFMRNVHQGGTLNFFEADNVNNLGMDSYFTRELLDATRSIATPGSTPSPTIESLKLARVPLPTEFFEQLFLAYLPGESLAFQCILDTLVLDLCGMKFTDLQAAARFVRTRGRRWRTVSFRHLLESTLERDVASVYDFVNQVPEMFDATMFSLRDQTVLTIDVPQGIVVETSGPAYTLSHILEEAGAEYDRVVQSTQVVSANTFPGFSKILYMIRRFPSLHVFITCEDFVAEFGVAGEPISVE